MITSILKSNPYYKFITLRPSQKNQTYQGKQRAYHANYFKK